MTGSLSGRRLAEAAGSPATFACDADEAWKRVRCVKLSREDYRSASFLDGRFTDHRDGAWIDADALWSAVGERTADCAFIFHIGHVGSTLLSRLLGEHPGVFSVREPQLLRRLARSDGSPPHRFEAATEGLLRLWSRTWTADQTAVVKATSFVAERATELLDRVPSASALLMFVGPLSYLRTILGGAASRIEAQALAQARHERLRRRFAFWPATLKGLSEGESVARSWLCETAALQAAAAAHPGRTRWLDFDRFLADPPAGLAHALQAFGIPGTQQAIDALLSGSTMHRYSKGPEHAYDAGLRHAVLMQAERTHGVEIRRGMDWLGAAAAAHPPVRSVLETAARVRTTP